MTPEILNQKESIIYPDSDGKPMADNTKQFRWIVTIKENLESLFAQREDVFVAGDLLWYPVKGNNTISAAPDAMVVIGRPKGDRGSYKQWCEDDIAPQVVFEILSPSNTDKEMARKLKFYEDYQVEEYYIYDPDRNDLKGWLRIGDRLEVIESMDNWISPKLKIKFILRKNTLDIYRPDGKKFLTHTELDEWAQQQEERANFEAQRYQQLMALLQEKGINLEDI